MAVIGNLVIGMSANTGKFVKETKAAANELGSFALRATKAASALTGINFGGAIPLLAKLKSGIASAGGQVVSFKGLIAGLSVGAIVGGIAVGWEKVASASSDLNEQVSKASTVFGDAVSVVKAGAQQMGDDFGYPKKEFYDAASSIGLIGKASGLTQEASATLGTNFAKLAADASSFYNVPLEESLGAIRSGLVGEAEPMRRFGVLLSSAAVDAKAAELGFKKVNGAYTEGAKVQARSALISAGLSDAQGDLARTAASAANQVRSVFGRLENLQADVGSAIAPITDQVLLLANSAVKVLADELTKNSEAFGDWAKNAGSSGGLVTQVFLGIGQGIGMMLDGIQYAIGAWDLFKGTLVGLTTVVHGALLKMIEPLIMLLDMLPGIDGQIKAFTSAYIDEMSRTSKESLAHGMQMFNGEASSKGVNEFFAKVAAESVRATAAMNEAAAASGNVKKGLKEVTNPAKDLSTKIETLENGLKAEIDQFGKSTKASAVYKLELEGATKAQLKQAYALQAKRDKMVADKKQLDKDKAAAKKFVEATRNPLDEFTAKYKEAKDLLGKGLITQKQFDQGAVKLKNEYNKDAAPGKTYSAAMQMGSQEARSTILAFRGQSLTDADPTKQAVKLGEKQLSLQEKIHSTLIEIKDKAAIKADVPAGTSIGQALSFA